MSEPASIRARRARAGRAEEQRYEVTAEAIRAYAEATDDPSPAALEGRDRAARLRDRARLGDDRPRVALRRLGRGAQARRPLRAGHDPAPADRGRDEARLACDAGRAARAAERDLARDPDRDATRGRRARQRAVRDRVLPRRRRAEEPRRAAARIIGSTRRTGRRAAGGDRATRSRDDQTTRYAAASGDDFEIHLDDEAARASGFPAGSSTASAPWRSPVARSSKPPASTTRSRSRRLAVRFSAPLRPGGTHDDPDLAPGRAARLRLRGARLRRTLVIKDGRAELRP